jgi:hypothetical protein
MLLFLHVAVSIVGLFSGVVVVSGLLKNKPLPLWTAVFLASTFATSASGYLFPSHTIGPPQIVGGVSLVTLVLAGFAYYARRLVGRWRTTYVVSAVLAFYLNAFVGVVQAFDKIPFLHPLAPHGSGPVFALAQVALFTLFGALGFRARARFHPKLAL